MAKITQYSRISHHTIFGTANAGLTFSIPTSSEDFTDGTWTIYDLALSEIGVNEEDKKVYIRIDDEIKEFEFVGGTAGDETLADTLIAGNTTGGTDISMSSGDNITSDNGGSFISLDYLTTPDRLYMGQTGSYVDLNNGTTTVVGTTDAVLRVNGSNRLSISSSGTSTLQSTTFSVNSNLSMVSGKSIKSSNGNSSIQMDAFSLPETITIQTDAYSTNPYMILTKAGGASGEFIKLGFNNGTRDTYLEFDGGDGAGSAYVRLNQNSTYVDVYDNYVEVNAGAGGEFNLTAGTFSLASADFKFLHSNGGKLRFYDNFGTDSTYISGNNDNTYIQLGKFDGGLEIASYAGNNATGLYTNTAQIELGDYTGGADYLAISSTNVSITASTMSVTGVVEFDSSVGITSDLGDIPVAGSITFTDSYPILNSYGTASLPNPVTAGAGALIYVSNESGGAQPAFSDGANWRRFTDRAIVS